MLELDDKIFGWKGLYAVSWTMLILGLCLYGWGRSYISGTMVFGGKDRLITSGPFHYTRNPIYVADMLIFMGFALLINSPYVFILLLIMTVILLLLPF